MLARSAPEGLEAVGVRVLMVILAVVVAMIVIGAIVEALKWLLILAGAVFLVGLVGGWSRRRSIGGGYRRSLR